MSRLCGFLAVFLWLLAPALTQAHSAIEALPRDEQSWRDRLTVLNQRVAEEGKRAQVLFVGDSLMQHWEAEGKEVWDRYYGARNVVDLGISGDETQHVLWRLDHGNLTGLDPKVVVILIGTNNVNTEATCVAQTADGVAAIVAKLRERLPHARVLLLALLPREENPGLLRGNVLQVNQIIRRLADDQHVFWVDFGYRFVNSDGTIPRSLMRDYLHLTTEGYRIWADAMEDRLCALLGDAHVDPARAVE